MGKDHSSQSGERCSLRSPSSQTLPGQPESEPERLEKSFFQSSLSMRHLLYYTDKEIEMALTLIQKPDQSWVCNKSIQSLVISQFFNLFIFLPLVPCQIQLLDFAGSGFFFMSATFYPIFLSFT